MRIFLAGLGLTAAEIALSSEDIEKFKCRKNAWQLPQDCGSDCTEADKTNLECRVELKIDDDDSNFLRLTASGVPDHNSCAAPPRSTILEFDYDFLIPREPVMKSGDPETFPATNMGAIGFAINGVPIYNPYDSQCCDAGLYELEFLDLCYAHPNGPNGMYHYHTWSECLAPCTGESQLIGIAMDGYPIYGPGINPATGEVWSQNDMDACGGQEINGKYAYYTTVDFPYILQCYRGITSSTLENGSAFQARGNCGLWGQTCTAGSTVDSGNRRPPAPNGRKRRNGKIDRTHEWFRTLQHLDSHGKTSAYASELLASVKNSQRKRRGTGEDNLLAAIEVYEEKIGTISVETFLKHLSYQCTSCNGYRDLVTDCTALRSDTCDNTESILVFAVTELLKKCLSAERIEPETCISERRR